jgi:serine/threonine protein kinase
MQVACKVITMKMDSAEQLLKSFIKEIEAYNELSGAFILKIYGYTLKEPASNEDDGKCAVIMEFMSRDSLTTVVRQKEKLSLNCKLDMAWNVASGLRKLHGRKMIHRDIRPDNILIIFDYTAKIGDMGIARKFDGVVQNLTQVGCMRYMPPEFWAQKYDQSLDIFTYGLTIYYLFTETVHLHEPAPVNRAGLPKESPIFNKLIIRCIDNDPSRRPSAVELETTFYTYKRAFDKHVEVHHPAYNKLNTEAKNKIFNDFYESFHPSAMEALEAQFPRSQSQTHISIDADVVRAMLLMALLQHMQDSDQEEENDQQT